MTNEPCTCHYQEPKDCRYHGPLIRDATDLSYIDIVFDGPPSREAGRFIEVENSEGCSIRVGQWIDRGNGLWALRIPRSTPTVSDDAN